MARYPHAAVPHPPRLHPAPHAHVAQQFAQRDEALIEYYAKITKAMPGRVLGKNHGIVTAVRGEQVYRHRRMARGYLSGTLRYEVMKRARYRCELCGVSAAEVALEVDHIQPRSLGGSDDLSNLQALCYRCNAMKGNQDDANIRGGFRGMHQLHGVRESGCLFCTLSAELADHARGGAGLRDPRRGPRGAGRDSGDAVLLTQAPGR